MGEVAGGEHVAGFKGYDLLHDIIGDGVVRSSQRVLVDEGCGAVRNDLLFDAFDLTGRKIEGSSRILDGKGAIDGSEDNFVAVELFFVHSDHVLFHECIIA